MYSEEYNVFILIILIIACNISKLSSKFILKYNIYTSQRMF